MLIPQTDSLYEALVVSGICGFKEIEIYWRVAFERQRVAD